MYTLCINITYLYVRIYIHIGIYILFITNLRKLIGGYGNFFEVNPLINFLYRVTLLIPDGVYKHHKIVSTSF